MTEREEKLEPCPKCGSPVETNHYTGDDDWWWIVCDNQPECDVEYGALERTFRSEEDLISSWNNRPTEDKLKARIAELEWALTDIQIMTYNFQGRAIDTVSGKLFDSVPSEDVARIITSVVRVSYQALEGKFFHAMDDHFGWPHGTFGDRTVACEKQQKAQ